MKVVKGNKLIDFSKEDLRELIEKHEKVHIDLGTGDGRFVFKNAIKDKKTLYIGIDPSQKQLETYSKKANRKKLENTLFILDSIENLPPTIFGIADNVNILFPWGSLLEYIAKPNLQMVRRISNLLKNAGELTIIFGYDEKIEAKTVEKAQLSKLDIVTINKKIAAAFKHSSLKIEQLKELRKAELKKIESTWGKRLSFGKDRPVYLLRFKKC